MTIQNAIKKLEKNGFMTTVGNTGNVIAVNPKYRRWIEVLKNGYTDDVSVIDLRTPGHDDDIMTDYHAGTFCNNITQAIRYATTWN